MSHNDFLTGDLLEVGNGVLDDFLVTDRFAQALSLIHI